MYLKPIAFCIRDFKSIQDSGVCHLSRDGITVLAGQNESGKTSILRALSDFDLEEDTPPETLDFIPDHAPDDENCSVSLCFELDRRTLDGILKSEKVTIPAIVQHRLASDRRIWIRHDLQAQTFHLSDDILSIWGETDAISKRLESEMTDGQTETNGVEGDTDALSKEVTPSKFATLLRSHWPPFTYFDSFGDLLPREFPVPAEAKTPNNAAQARQTATQNARIPRIVEDFLKLAAIDLQKVRELSTDKRALKNYLQNKSANITGDFLNFWKQRSGPGQVLELKAEADHDPTGQLKLSFYVHDKYNQYPDQRSQGFRWFLSFYLRLAASIIEDGDQPQLVLIDEPGTFLHAKAQSDVLDLLEDRITKRDLVIYSTHSPYLLPHDRLHRVRIVAKDEESGTFIADKLTDNRLLGDAFTDALSPVMTAIGIGFNQSFSLVNKQNVLVEGISEFYYLHSWSKLIGDNLLSETSVFPATGAASITTLASLMIGWGVEFCCLLDRDSNGKQAAKKLVEYMGIGQECIVHPNDAAGIEDIFSPEDFRLLLKAYDERYTLEAKERPTSAIKRQKPNKVLLATRYAELVSKGEVCAETTSETTKENIRALFAGLEKAISTRALAVSPN